MNFNEYQKQAKATAKYPDLGNNYLYPTLGLCGEAGELANKIKKIQRDDQGIVTDQKREEIKLELGDVLWYASQLACEFGLDFDDVAGANLKKLSDRHMRGVISGSGDGR